MANVTVEDGVYDDQGTPQELHCRAFVTYDNVTGAVSRLESWENTYPFAWNLVPRPGAAPILIAANSSRTNRLNVTGYFITDPWTLSRAA